MRIQKRFGSESMQHDLRVLKHKTGLCLALKASNLIQSHWSSRNALRSRRVPSPNLFVFPLPNMRRSYASQKIAVYLSHKKDDSYTPEKMGIRAGTSLRDLQEVRTVRFEKPEGWIEFAVSSEDNNQQDELDLNGGGTYALLIAGPEGSH